MDDAESNATRNKKGRSAERAGQQAREKVLKQYGIMEDDITNRQFADPAAMF